MNNLVSSIRKPLSTLIISSVLLIGILIFTQPLELPLVGLFVPFFVLFIWLRSVGLVGLNAFYKTATMRKKRTLASASASVIFVIIVLQSLGQLSWRDLIIVISLLIALAVYFSKTDLL